jgi:hypothetical protein
LSLLAKAFGGIHNIKSTLLGAFLLLVRRLVTVLKTTRWVVLFTASNPLFECRGIKKADN